MSPTLSPTLSLVDRLVSARFAIVGAALVMAEQAAACPACVDPRAQTTTAMLISTACLSLVPLAFIGSVAAWVVRNGGVDRADRANEANED